MIVCVSVSLGRDSKEAKKEGNEKKKREFFFACETAEKGKCNGRVFDKKGDCSGIKTDLMWLSGCPECCCRQSSGSSHLEVTLLILFFIFQFFYFLDLLFL